MIPYLYTSRNSWVSLGVSFSMGQMNCGHTGFDISIDFVFWHLSLGVEW